MRQSEVAPGIGDYAALIRRRGIWIATILPALILLSTYLAYALPAQYESTATVLLEPSSIPQELIKTTVASYANQQIQIISGRVMALDTLKELVQQYDPYPRSNLSVEQKAQRILADTTLQPVDPVTFEPLEKSEAFSLHYRNPTPARASQVAQRLADLFLTYHQRERTRAAQEATRLVRGEADELNNELRALDGQIAQLKEKYGDALPDSRDRNEVGRDQAERDLEDLQRQERAAEERQELLRVQLSGLSPNLLANKGDLTDLATVKAQLADAEQRYTPDHPDVKRLRRALESLLAQQNARGGAAPIKADNPEYIRVSSEYDAAHKEVVALQSGAERARSRVGEYSARLRSSPEIERQYSELQRRRESLGGQYQQAVDRVKSAEMGQVFEAQEQGEHFTLLRAPYPARSPVYPNRLGLILLGLLLGGAIAAIAVSIAESSDATVRGARDVSPGDAALFLGGVPNILRPQDERRRKLAWGSVCTVYLVALLVVFATIIQAQLKAHDAVGSTATQESSRP
jgi:polysaccharide chain length determinant protein (PEP-CTERM system associated)